MLADHKNKGTHRVPLPLLGGNSFSAYCSAMPPDREDNNETKTRKHTPAYDNGFGPNTDKLHHLLVFTQNAIKNYTIELTALSTNLTDLRGSQPGQVEKIHALAKEIGKHVKELTGGVIAIHEMMPVIIVAVVEAYLKDVLIFAAGIDATLMERTEQAATYQAVLNANSLEALLLDFRGKWARRFVDSGGPTKWINSLEAMGARSYRLETVSQMETLWGVRHLIVHSAGIANGDFVRRHPELKGQVGKRFIVNNAQIKQWVAAMYDFVEVTDQYFVQRCQKSQKPFSNGGAEKIAEI